MNNNCKLLLLLCVLCQSCSQSIIMNTIIPEPLVGIIEEVNVAVMYDENILDYQFENNMHECPFMEIKDMFNIDDVLKNI